MTKEPTTKGHYRILITHPSGEEGEEIFVATRLIEDPAYIGELIVAEVKRLNVTPLLKR